MSNYTRQKFILRTVWGRLALPWNFPWFGDCAYVNCCTTARKIAFEKACNRRMTLKVTQGHRKWRDRPYDISCSNASVLHRLTT